MVATGVLEHPDPRQKLQRYQQRPEARREDVKVADAGVRLWGSTGAVGC